MLPFLELCAESARVEGSICRTFQIIGDRASESEQMCSTRLAGFPNPSKVTADNLAELPRERAVASRLESRYRRVERVVVSRPEYDVKSHHR
jgi:hypothetical protein